VDPGEYEAWYHTSRGRWIAARETAVLLELLRPAPGAAVLDAGCGTGHFSRRLAGAGLAVTGADIDRAALCFARDRAGGVRYLAASMNRLPFADAAFDYGVAVTSLCFVGAPAAALAELVRVSRRGVVLGLLNRRSLLYYRKRGRGAYRGARWDGLDAVRRWRDAVDASLGLSWRSAVFLPGGGPVARLVERVLPGCLPLGAFLCVYLERSAA
jgi:SAM-dependent methyltransferase